FRRTPTEAGPALAGKKRPTVTVTVRELAGLVGGEVLGDGELPITNARTLAEAESGDITFVEHDKHLAAWHTSRASAAIVPQSVPVTGRPITRVAAPPMAFARVVQHLRGGPRESAPTISPAAHIHPTARLGGGASVGAGAVIGEGTEIGPNAVIHPGVV